jgi:hypothetical protein
MQLVDRTSTLWAYLQPEIQALVVDCEILIDIVEEDTVSQKITDYSFVVFPIAKAYEGFLKRLFMDIGIIEHDEYYSDEIRIGRILNPKYQKELSNAFTIMGRRSAQKQDMLQLLWDVWKKGRNLVFHFFPHNYRRLTREEAVGTVREVVDAMDMAIQSCDIPKMENHPITSVRP